MYKVLVDGIILYHPKMPSYELISGQLSQELNTSGTLILEIPQRNPSYGQAKLMKSVVQLFDDEVLLFEGRPYSPNYDLYKNNKLTIEGELSYFNDSIYSPFSYSGDVKTFFTSLIDSHNQQVDERRQFTIGEINITNSTVEGNITRSSDSYNSTWKIIKEKLLDMIGGYLWIRHEDGKRIIDYVDDLNHLQNQPIVQALNLVDAKKEITSVELATVILPLGAKKTKEDGIEERITIESVNNGSRYLESPEGIVNYGRIIKVVEHDDITLETNLLRAAKKDLGQALGLTRSISITASDLNKAGYKEYDPFKVGSYIDVKVKNLDIDERMLVRKLTIDLLNPTNNQLSIGSETTTLTANNYKTTTSLEERIVNVNKNATEKIVNSALETIRQVNSLITSNNEQLASTFSEQYYDKNNVDNLLSEISTIITQTAEAITIEFNRFVNGQADVNENNEERFNEINKYIRFENGDIILGNSNSKITLRIQNDKIAFLESGVEVAYISDNKLYITNAEILSSLKLGKFAFIPRNNGNLSFKKVG